MSILEKNKTDIYIILHIKSDTQYTCCQLYAFHFHLYLRCQSTSENFKSIQGCTLESGFWFASLYCSFQSVCNTCKSLHIVIGGYMQGPRLSNYNNNSAKSPMSGNMSQDVKQRPRKYKKITDPDGLGSEAWLNFQLDVNAIMACLPW